MKQIQMVDLFGQYERIKPEIDQAINNVIQHSSFIKGPTVSAFENSLANYLGVKHVIGCGNGTDALMLALMSLELQPGDEIISPNFTFISTVEVISFLGLKPVLVDVDADTFNMDIEQLMRVTSSKTKAIIPVHLFGQCANMEEIMAWSNKHHIPVIEDTAQALGAKYTFTNTNKSVFAGSMGTIGCTSFFPSKNLGCFGDGGALFTNDDNLAEKIRLLANHGMRQKYQYESVGMNSRLDGIQAAILDVKLTYLDSFNEQRSKAAAKYDQAFENCQYVQTPNRNKQSSHIYHQYTLKLDAEVNRKSLQQHLHNYEIPSMVYYPTPMHNQPAYKQLNQNDQEFPVTMDICNRVLSLPMHSELDDNQIDFITEKLTSFFK